MFQRSGRNNNNNYNYFGNMSESNQEVTGRPSEAYFKSMEMASSRPNYVAPGDDVQDGPRPIGPKTLCCAFTLFIVGLILFITGCVIYWGDKAPSTYGKGFDMLMLGAGMLLPGSYAVYIVYGSFRGWRGYDSTALANFDELR